MQRRALLLASLATLPSIVRPSAVGAQTRAGLPRVGFLLPDGPEPTVGHVRNELRRLGYVEGRTVAFEVRAAAGRSERLPAMAAELVKSGVDVIVTRLTPSAYAARAATSSIPIIMAVGDPVRTGLVSSLSHPGGNITGIAGATIELSAKLLAIVRDTFPGAGPVGVLANAEDPFTTPFLEQLESARGVAGVSLDVERVAVGNDYGAAFTIFERKKVRAVIVQPSLRRVQAIGQANARRLPTASPYRAFATEGGLLAYSGNPRESERKMAHLVDRILKGAKPADLPVELPTEYLLAINLKAARALGIEIPLSVLVRADDVIE